MAFNPGRPNAVLCAANTFQMNALRFISSSAVANWGLSGSDYTASDVGMTLSYKSRRLLRYRFNAEVYRRLFWDRDSMHLKDCFGSIADFQKYLPNTSKHSFDLTF
jgi:hypothetical protein